MTFKPFIKAVLMANESARGCIDDFFAFANELKADGGWVQLTPFGRFQNAQGLQEVRPVDCEAMVNEFKSFASLPQRLIGLPWYIGHPDHHSFKATYTDTKAYGRIKALETRHAADCAACATFANERRPGKAVPCKEHGLFANVKWNDAGKRLIESEAFHGHSVNWFLNRDGGVFHPFSLKSVGFTNEPGIPAHPVLSANEAAGAVKPLDEMKPVFARLADVRLLDRAATKGVLKEVKELLR